MKQATIFALHFARLFSQLVHDPDNQEATRSTVDQLLAENRAAVTLAWDNWQLVADGDVLSGNMPGVNDVVARMAAHGVREITFSAGIEPGPVLGAIWILAKEPVIGDGGANALTRLAKLGTSGVRFVAVAAPAAPQPPATPAVSELAMSFDFDLYEPEPETPSPEPDVSLSSTDHNDLYQQFSSPVETAEVLLERLKSLTNVDQLARTMESIANMIAELRSSQKIGEAADMLTEVVAAEPRFTDPAAKRLFGIVLRRIVSHSLLLSFAADLPRSRPRHSQYMTLFARFGDDAVDALIEQLVYAELAKERRVLFNAIVELRRGVPALVRMLADGRWYVARNAAELLGEMRAVEAEASLIQGLRHDDARVRRSAAAALAKLGTPTAMAALTDAMRDASPNVRMQATLAIATRKEPRTTAIFLRALMDEQDPEVQRALFTALGRIGTPEAVRRLISESEPDKGFFKKKAAATRVAAVQGLAEARTAEALAALESLSKDKEREVRDAAAKGLTGGSDTRPQGGW